MFDSLYWLILTVLVFCVGIQFLRAVAQVAVAKPRLALMVAKRVKDWLQGKGTSDGPKSGPTTT